MVVCYQYTNISTTLFLLLLFRKDYSILLNYSVFLYNTGDRKAATKQFTAFEQLMQKRKETGPADLDPEVKRHVDLDLYSCSIPSTFYVPAVTLVSLSKTLAHCFVLLMGRKAIGPVCCVSHVKEPRALIEKRRGLPWCSWLDWQHIAQHHLVNHYMVLRITSHNKNFVPLTLQ